ncbi:proline--tRNA ligase [Buchnera aphidicola (Neophyllaphis varicolor)]|uniref:proline--tRNA ligase n=1 Tax=Buchnera aphidicola TaxID=9 RepID=UPI0031B84F9F
MKITNYLLSTLKKSSLSEDIKSNNLMLRAGIIRKLSSGIYTWLPTGLKIIKKIENIIRKELDNIGALEIQMPTIQPAKLWNKSKRWDIYGLELMKFNDRKNKKFVLGPTHEEVITTLIKNEIKSYKELPIILYQITNKFRDEIRPRFGVIRSKEFKMKDCYSFHANNKSLISTYKLMYETYIKIFNRLKLKFKIVEANNGAIGGDISHEFQALNECEANKICFSKKEKKNKYHIETEKTNNKNNIEIGHIFKIGKKYSQIFQSYFQNKNGTKKLLHMGCYGIGINRIIASLIEQNNDVKGIIWNKNIAPFKIAILPINIDTYIKVKILSENIYNFLNKQKIDVLFYNKIENIGVMFSNIELIGIPNILVVSKNSINNNYIEHIKRKNNQKTKIRIENIYKYIINI